MPEAPSPGPGVGPPWHAGDPAPNPDAAAPDAGDPDAGAGQGADADAPAPGRLGRLVEDAKGRATAAADDVERRWPQVGILRDLWHRYLEANAAALAGYLAFRMFLWLLPLTLVLLAAVGIAQDQGVDVVGASDEDLGLGRSLAAAIRQSIEQTQSSRVHLAWVAVSGLLLATSGLLKALHLTHATAWQIPERKVARRASLMGRILGAAPLIVILVIGSSALRRAGPVGGLAGTALTAAIFGGILLGLLAVLPRRTDDLWWLLPGPAVGAVLSVGLQAFAAYYLPGRLSTMSDTYGAIGITVVILAYLLLLGQILVISPLVSATAFARWGPTTTGTPEPGLPPPPGSTP